MTLAVITTEEEQQQAYAAAEASLTGAFKQFSVNFHIGIRRKDGMQVDYLDVSLTVAYTSSFTMAVEF